MNLVVETGRFADNPELFTSKENKPICRFRIAIKRPYFDRKDADVDFFNCICFNNNAEYVKKYMKKGDKANIHGRLKCNRYKDKNDTVHYFTEIIVSEIEFFHAKKNNDEDAEEYMPLPNKKEMDKYIDIEEEALNLDDLPF